ncbi:MAG: xanthine dehydrogenase family protein molybdopterin-binding subunit [Gemmatimonadota bacterium]|nr:MAG: xanthine dehydrogenase family protein molybdopterin-binding subunit [Gemmatimonadota bacterium]
MNAITKVSRREFLKLTGVAGTGLVLGFHLPPKPDGWAAVEPLTNSWLRIGPDGEVTFWVHRPDMGQGARTALPMILADELDIEWPQFERVFLPAVDPQVYGSQTAGGSTSIRTSWVPLRTAGATARAMLTSAAAETWGVDAGSCRASLGTVVHESSGRSLSYGELAEKAATLPVPDDPPFKDPEDFHIVGKPTPRLDNPARVNGSLTYGMDVKVSGMLHACIARCPVFGGSVTGYDEAAARAVDGVRGVVEVPTGVAVLADSTWAAIKGRRALNPKFDYGESADLSSAKIAELFDEKQAEEGYATLDDGDADAALAGAAQVLDAVYEVPYIAHSPLEPMNCTADARDDRCEIWAPTQAPQWAHGVVAQTFGYEPQNVTLNIAFSGGGFGRRLIPDFVVEAVHVSKAAAAPVKVVWTREDTMHHGYYRPASRHILRAGLDDSGNLIAWKHRVVAHSIGATLQGSDLRGAAREATSGARDLPYTIPNCHVDFCMANTIVPVGYFRSVYNTQTPFANETFIDELATAAGVDPVVFRMRMLDDHPRHRGVLGLAAEKARWGQPLPDGHYQGIALHYSFGSWAAEVAEVSVGDDGSVRVHKVICAVDCGIVVNPDDLAAQAEGAIVIGLTAALKAEITIDEGRVVQGNYNDYPLLRIDEMPEIEVHYVKSDVNPTGVGEPPLPPIAPAVANAIFAASGVRVRRMPIRPEDIRGT